jgi:hypothetical protein
VSRFAGKTARRNISRYSSRTASVRLFLLSIMIGTDPAWKAMLNQLETMISETDRSSRIHEVPRKEHAEALHYFLEAGKYLARFQGSHDLKVY